MFNKGNKKNKIDTCSFCGKYKSSVELLINAGEGLYICNECVDECNEILAENRNEKKEPNNAGRKKFNFEIRYPEWIFKRLSKHVIGQERAKKILSVAVFDHLLKLNAGKSLRQKNWN